MRQVMISTWPVQPQSTARRPAVSSSWMELAFEPEKAYAWLDICQRHETEISAAVDSSILRIMSYLRSGGSFGETFAQMVQALNTDRRAGTDAVELLEHPFADLGRQKIPTR